MNSVEASDIVRSIAGRDTDKLFFVLRIENGFAYLADGKLRRCDHPKKKRLKHLRFAAKGNGAAAAKLRLGGIPTNRELREAMFCLGSERQDVEEGS